MNWFKKATVETFEDRRRLIDRIHAFEEIIAELNYLSKFVPQSPPIAQNSIRNILKDKKMSSFPVIKDILQKAYEIARDNYAKFYIFCQQAIAFLLEEISKMKKEKQEFNRQYRNKD